MEEIVYHTNYQLEDSYWWFVARNRIVTKMISKKCRIEKGADFLDVGCGTGGFTKLLSGKYNMLGLDFSPIALEYCRKRGLENLYQGTLSDFPAKKWNVKAMTFLDVIEHIREDEGVVKEAYNILPEGGYLIASVPAYKWLWSKHDEIHHHERRYTRKKFISLLKRAGFRIEYASYFNTFLFPLAALKRIFEKITGKGEEKVAPVDEVSPFINKIFTAIFKAEGLLLPMIRFPFGVSILVIAKK